MSVRKLAIVPIAVLSLVALVPFGGSKTRDRSAVAGTGKPVLWRDPAAGKGDLFYGPGSKERAPHAPFRFLKEDLGGTSPKYDVRDADGVKWKVKLGREARAETTATRLVWAAGYFVDEDYLIPELRLEGLPARLKRHKLIEPGGVMHNARLEREIKKEVKLGTWKWRENPFVDTREWNGLRAMMALLNNWDVKDVNNSIYQGDGERIYLVSDLGATFGATGRSWPASRSKDNYSVYRATRFLCGEHGALLDFCAPNRASIAHLVDPLEFVRRAKLRWIGRNIPRADAKWLGALLARLTPEQIRDAFRAGGYSPAEIDGFSEVVERRIAALNDL